MAKKILSLLLLVATLGCIQPAAAAEAQTDTAKNDNKQIDVKEVIFHHLGDGYGWEVPFSHILRLPLPVIVRANDNTWHIFSSSRLTEVEVIEDINTGKYNEELKPVVYTFTSNDKTYHFTISHEGENANKVVQLLPLTPAEQETQTETEDHQGYINEGGTYYKEYKPIDLSITKNVLAVFIAAFIVWLLVWLLVRHYRRYGFKAPRKGMGFFELLVDFIYTGVIKDTLKDKAPRFAPYLLTAFFFILTMNLLGLIVIFPGGANLTGNIAVTLVLALLTFFMTNLNGTRHYWKEIFWPDVPIWLKCPLPIMQVIEIFGIFTKPAALCVRLFANMMGGHMIVLTLTCLIFIFAAFGAVATGSSVVISIVFTIFMLALDVLVSFIQAYVFTMLSTIFIGLAQHHEEEKHDKEHTAEGQETPASIEA